MKAAVYMSVHSVDSCDTVDTELSYLPPFCNKKIDIVKDFKKVFISMHDSVPCANGFWHKKFGIEKHIWSLPSLVTKQPRLWVLQWKLVNNVYLMNIFLYKMKVRANQTCSYFNNVVDYIEHCFFDCRAVQKFWKQVELYILVRLFSTFGFI